jgi:hypothetical protein
MVKDGLFKSDGKNLYIKGKKVLRGWESFSGWYWFAVEEVRKQDSVLSHGRIAKDDTIFFGFVQGLEEEWGYFSLAELESLRPMVWEIPKKNLSYSGRRQK